MNGRLARKLRKMARKIADRENEMLVPKFKTFINTELKFWERAQLAWRMLWRRF
jgi:hypothetical protein